MIASTRCGGTRYCGAIFFTSATIAFGADAGSAGSAACRGAGSNSGSGAAGGRMQSGGSGLGAPTCSSMVFACSMPCPAAAWKKNAASASSRFTPRP